MSKWNHGLITLGAIVALTGTVEAQQPGGGRSGLGLGRAGGGGPGIVAFPQVQQELGINEEQAGRVETIVAELRDAMGGLRDQLANLEPRARMEKARELMSSANEKARAALAEVLDEGQQQRLDQIELQLRGAEAFAEAKVQEALELTEEQKEKVQALLADLDERQNTIRQQAQGDFRAAMTQMRELRNEVLAKAKELLNEAQTAKWDELTGEPFELTFGPPGAGGPGGRRPGGPSSN